MAEQSKRRGPHGIVVCGVTPAMCLEILVVLGPGANVKDLHKRVELIHGRSPSQQTLQSWWDRFGWGEELRRRWEELQKAARMHLESQTEEAHVDRAAGLKRICGELLTIANTMVAGGGQHPSGKYIVPPLKLTGKVGELQILMSTMIQASQHLELLTGGATDRVETRSLLSDMNDELLTREFAKRFGVTVPLGDDTEGKPH